MILDDENWKYIKSDNLRSEKKKKNVKKLF